MAQFDEVMKNFNKKFKEDLVHYGLGKYDYDRIPFTSPRLNYMTFGGIPIGKLTEFSGSEGSGKTSTALDIVANYQNMEDVKKVLWVDCENTLDTVWAHKLGVDVESMILLQPTNQGAEEIFQFILDAIDTGEIGLTVLDSIGVMVSNQAMEKTVAEKTYGGIAMALTNFSEKAVGLCHKHDSTFIAINQLRDDLDSMFGGTKTVGGRAWRHNTSVRIEFRQGKYFDFSGNDLSRAAENPAGNYVLATMIKNKTCPPIRRQGFYTLNYLKGIDYLKDLVEVAIKEDLIFKKGAWYSVVNTDTGEELANLQGVNKVYEFLESHVDVQSFIEEKLDIKIKDLDLGDNGENNKDKEDNTEESES